MFGWSKREKNEKLMNKAKVELGRMSLKDKAKRLSRLRKKNHRFLDTGGYDFEMELFDYEMVIMYLMLIDAAVVDEADIFDTPVDDSMVKEESPVADSEIEEEDAPAQEDVSIDNYESESEVVKSSSFDSDTPVDSVRSYSSESTPTIESDVSRGSSWGGSSGGGSSSFDSGGCDSGGCDSGGCDSGGCD